MKFHVIQRERPEGYVVEGYMIYQTMTYIYQYSDEIGKIYINVLDFIWDVNSIDDFEGEHLLGKGRMSKVSCKYIVEIYNTFDLFVFMYIILI